MNACECQVEIHHRDNLQFNSNRTWDTICYAVKIGIKTKMSLSQRLNAENLIYKRQETHSTKWHREKKFVVCANTLDLTFNWSRIDKYLKEHHTYTTNMT